jgi:hypothetical protein
MIHDNYTIIKLQQNPKNHRPKNKTAPTFNKKYYYFFVLFQNKINNTKSPLKCGNQGEKKKPVDKINRELLSLWPWEPV